MSEPESKAARKPSIGEEGRVDDVIRAQFPRTIHLLQKLVQTPSENLPPDGGEHTCQELIAGWLRELGIEPDVYRISDVPGLFAHAEFRPGRNYADRPNVNAVLKGSGGGRSVILTGHIDTVPADTPVPWTREPFAGAIETGRLFGRGAWDMKAGIAMSLAVLGALREVGLRLAGDLIFESVVDEEYGGVNGTLAARLRGYSAEAAIVGEPTSLCICPAQRGGRIVHILLRGEGGILSEHRPGARAVDQLAYVLSRLPEFAALRARRIPVHPYYLDSKEPFAVWVTNIATGRWGWTQPIAAPATCRLELYWQLMPDETSSQSESEFNRWWDEITAARRDLFASAPALEAPMRCLPGCATAPDHPLVTEFAESAASLGIAAPVRGMDAPSDMYVFPKLFHTPALMWGPSGAGAHQADEYVELESLLEATLTLARFVCRWCGIAA